MAKARMLHKSISVSIQANRLSLPARLLFTWMIPHADDEGKLKGDPQYIKAIVIPMTKWSFKRIKGYLEEMKNVGLIYYWQQKNEWFIEFMKWEGYQSIRKDRFIRSDLPSFPDKTDNQPTTTRQSDDDQEPPQSNISESNKTEVNKSEDKTNIIQSIADENSFKESVRVINPKSFVPKSEGESAAKEAWEKLEPHNPFAFQTTYLKALKKGLPPHLFYQFTSEIKQDSAITKPGAVFNAKTKQYFKEKGD